jgi:hypothetical protein
LIFYQETKNKKMREIKLIHSIVISIIILIGIVILYPINLTDRNYDCELKVLATGDKNSLSESAEVWILDVHSDLEQVESITESEVIDSNWIQSGERLVAVKWPASVRYSVEASEYLTLRLYKHDWSGKAKVFLNDKLVKDLDLYTANKKLDYIDLTITPSEYFAGKGVFSTFTTVIFNILKLYIPILLLVSYFLLLPFRIGVLTIFNKLGWMKYATPSLVVFSIYLLIYYPALMTADSVAQWAQMQGFIDFSDAHPPFHTFINWLLTRIWYSPTSIALFQLVSISLIVAYGCGLVLKISSSRLLTWSIALIFALYPPNAIMANILWKDVLYSALLFLLFIKILEIVFTKSENLKKNSTWITMIVLSILISLIRHNGLLTTIPIILSIVLFYKHFWKQAVVSTLILSAVVMLFTSVIYPSMGIAKSKMGNALFLQMIGGYVNSGEKLPEEALNYYNSALPLEEWPFNCENIDDLMFNSSAGYFMPIINKNESLARKTAINYVTKHPLRYLEDRICGTKIVWQMSNKNTWYYDFNEYFPSKEDRIKWCGEPDVMDGIEEDSFFPDLNTTLTKLIKNKHFWWMWRPAIPLFFMIVLVLIYSFVSRQKNIILLLMPAFFQSAVVMVGCSHQSFRYQYPVVLIALFLIPLILFLIIKRKTIHPVLNENTDIKTN